MKMRKMNMSISLSILSVLIASVLRFAEKNLDRVRRRLTIIAALRTKREGWPLHAFGGCTRTAAVVAAGIFSLRAARNCALVTLLSILLFATVATRTTAQQPGQIILNTSSVIGGSGSWSASPWNSGGYEAPLVTDNQTASGSIDESSTGNYWLGKQGDEQEYFVLDLGAVYDLQSVTLYNTHNQAPNDRATGDFQLYVANAVAAYASGETGAGGMDLVSPVVALSGILTFPTNPIPPQSFNFPAGTMARYLRFNTLTMASGATQGVGLNEIQIFGAATTCATAPEGMISWWPADGKANDIQDSNNGTFVGEPSPGTYATGKVGQAFSFDGVDDYVDVGDVDLPSTFTIDAWVNPTSLANNPYIISKDDGGSFRSYYFAIEPTGTLVTCVRNTAGGFTCYRTGSPVISVGSWQHVAVTYDGNAGPGEKLKFYADGVNAPTSLAGPYDNGGTPENNALSAKIGIFGDGTSPFNGLIDELELFSRVLSGTEIANIVNAGNAGKCKPSADLDIDKSNASDNVLLGKNVTYEIEVENKGPDDATGVTVIDTLPASISFVSASSDCTFNSLSHTVTCNIGSLSKNTEVTRTITGQATVAGKITNTATVTASQADPDLTNNTDSTETTVVTLSKLSFSPSTVTGGCQNSIGTVKLTGGAPPGGVTISLSSNSAKASVPSTVVIAGNTDSATFTVTTQSVTTTQTPTITATLNTGLGPVKVSKTLTLLPVAVGSLTLSPTTVKGGNNVTGTVNLVCLAPADTVVTLSSSNTSVAKPAVSSITILKGQTSKTFTVQTFAVSSTKTANIKATANGISKQAVLTVTH